MDEGTCNCAMGTNFVDGPATMISKGHSIVPKVLGRHTATNQATRRLSSCLKNSKVRGFSSVELGGGCCCLNIVPVLQLYVYAAPQQGLFCLHASVALAGVWLELTYLCQ